jgi:hypothetical protein
MTMNRHGWRFAREPDQRAASAIASRAAESTTASVNARVCRTRNRGSTASLGGVESSMGGKSSRTPN